MPAPRAPEVVILLDEDTRAYEPIVLDHNPGSASIEVRATEMGRALTAGSLRRVSAPRGVLGERGTLVSLPDELLSSIVHIRRSIGHLTSPISTSSGAWEFATTHTHSTPNSPGEP